MGLHIRPTKCFFREAGTPRLWKARIHVTLYEARTVGLKFLGDGRWPALAGALAIFLLPVVACSCPSTPSVTSLSPSSAAAGGADFTLTVNGRHFDSNAVVVWNGTALTTSFVSNTQLAATIPSGDISNPGPAEVFVYNPGSTSDSTTVGSVSASDSNNCGAAGSNETPFTVSP